MRVRDAQHPAQVLGAGRAAIGKSGPHSAPASLFSKQNSPQSPLPSQRAVPEPRGQMKPVPPQRRFLQAQRVQVTGLSPLIQAGAKLQEPDKHLQSLWGGEQPEQGTPQAGSQTAPRAQGHLAFCQPSGCPLKRPLSSKSLCSPPCHRAPQCLRVPGRTHTTRLTAWKHCGKQHGAAAAGNAARERQVTKAKPSLTYTRGTAQQTSHTPGPASANAPIN